MIGWYCDMYITDSDQRSVIKGSDPNTLPYEDRHRVFPMYPNISQPYQDIQFNTSNELFAYLEQIVGEDAYRLYAKPSYRIYNLAQQNLTGAIPSSLLMYPNSFAKNSNMFPIYMVIYIPSLKKLLHIYHSNGVSNICTIYDTSTEVCVQLDEVRVNYEAGLVYPNSSQTGWDIAFFGYTGEYNTDGFSDRNNYVWLVAKTYKNKYLVQSRHKWDSGYIPDMSRFMTALFKDYVDPEVDASTPENPYEPGGPSDEGGGGGTFDDESDMINIPSIPTISSADTGFTRIYNPTLAQVQDLARYLWTEESVIETIWNHIKKYFENPMEAIIGFNLVPVPVPNGGTTTFKLMYIDTGVSMTAAANQFVDVDCGTLELKEYYGSALDYSPFTKISCFLPYIGNVSLNVDEVMGRTLGVKYRVDICSGACVAYITVDGNAIYQYSGHCSIPIPISAADFSSYVTSVISTAKLATAAITAGMGVAAGMIAGDPQPQTNKIVKITKQVSTARNPQTGRQITTGTTTTTVERPTVDQDNTSASFAGLAPQNIANTVGTIMGSKPHIEHSGSFSGNSGYLGVRRPFLIIQRPNMCMPSNYQQLNGFPSMITLKLSECTGFTRIQQVQLTELPATNPEQAEILQLLKTGVIL